MILGFNVVLLTYGQMHDALGASGYGLKVGSRQL